MFPALFSEQNFDFCDPILVRAALAGSSALLLALVFGTRIIRWLRARFREPIVSDSARLNELHQHKKSTPTMGGLFVVAGILLACLLCGDWTSGYLQIGILLTLSLTLLGAMDDLHKLRTGKRGLSPRAKLAGQLAISLVIALLLHSLLKNIPQGLELAIPLTNTSFSLGWLFVPLAMLVLVASSNAVNLTDGLDGLAGGCLICSTLGMLLLAYVAGQADLAAHWQVTHIPGASEIVVLAGAMLGALLGFLWFNCHPAKVFLGDTGSLPLGGLLGFFALVSRQELLLVVIGGVFVAEALSVVLQVGIFKWKRIRIFRCAPLHHHFQFLGWGEQRIVSRFWIAAACCTLLGLMTCFIRTVQHNRAQSSDSPLMVTLVSNHTTSAPLPVGLPPNDPAYVAHFGERHLEPVSGDGFLLFLKGEYIEAPYQISRIGLGIYINGHLVKKHALHSPYYLGYDPPFPAGLTRESGFEDPAMKDETGHDWLTRKYRYLASHLPPEEATEKYLDTIPSLPFVKDVFVVRDSRGHARSVKIVTFHDEVNEYVLESGMDFRPRVSVRDLSYFEEALDGWRETLSKPGFRWTGPVIRPKSKQWNNIPTIIEIFKSDESPISKAKLLIPYFGRGYPFHDPDAFQKVEEQRARTLAKFRGSPQLDERVMAIRQQRDMTDPSAP